MQRLLAFIQRHGLGCFSVAAMLLCLGGALFLQARHQISLLETANKLGPAAQSLIEGRGLAICYGLDPGGGPCLHAQRMPVAPLTIAALYLTFHQHTLLAAAVKTLVFLVPALLVFGIAWKAACQSPPNISPRARWFTLGLFLTALLLPPMLDTVVNLNFEEAYFYSAFALAVALLLFPASAQLHPTRWALGIWLCLTITYLTKSSTLPVAAWLAIASAWFLARNRRNPFLAVVFLLAFACVPLSWGLWQHHAGGRFSTGTSLDGVNLYKGNNGGVLVLYPAFRGASLDQTEASLFAGNVTLDEEWSANDFGMVHARGYMRSHPAATLQAGLRKASVFFFGVQRNVGEDPYPQAIELAFDTGLVLFRLMLLAALAFAVRNLFTNPARRFPAIVFLGCVVFAAIPYIVGFALTRHSLVLILPTAAYLSSLAAWPSQPA